MSKHSEIIRNDEVLRIVMVGKTGVGKSATANTILGKNMFKSILSFFSVTSECDKGKATVDGQPVTVVDTPGLFDTRLDEEKIQKALSLCINFASPGPHVFLVVISLATRFTEEEKQTVQKIQEIFGEAANRYSMVLFTNGDRLDDLEGPIEEFLKGELQVLVDKCNGQYHVFNNKLKDRTQVTELLKKIRNIMAKNGGSHYTTEMFQEAERAIEEEKLRILEKKEEEIRKEKEEMERKIKQESERKMEEFNKQMKAEREKERRRQEEEARRMREAIEQERRKMEEEGKRKIEEEKRRIQEEKEKEIRKKKEMERKIQEEYERKMKEQEEAKRKKIEEEQKRIQKKHDEEARAEAERNARPWYKKVCVTQ